uniref:Uncharacterized protein n=1 Tax=Lotus japonicus TaxID=34305 RepID=I3T9A4_LOTJA|nr:unknown [Lotus japonicus]
MNHIWLNLYFDPNGVYLFYFSGFFVLIETIYSEINHIDNEPLTNLSIDSLKKRESSYVLIWNELFLVFQKNNLLFHP